ncbi:MAG: hypothetical protein JJ975_05465 [Bacteroidia bacterium]|nr:hypothetical protein [Bacteroidia bacterium]
MKWLSAVGLIFQFVAFWFAAPELLGAATLKRLEVGIRRFATLAPLIIILLIIFGYGLTFLGIAAYNMYVLSETGEAAINPKTYFIYMGLFTALYLAIMLNYKRVRRFLEHRVGEPLTQRIINSSETRKTALFVGAILFTLGFLLQLLAVLLS